MCKLVKLRGSPALGCPIFFVRSSFLSSVTNLFFSKIDNNTLCNITLCSCVACTVLLDGIDRADFQDVMPYFEVIDMYLRVDDSLKTQRCETLITDAPNSIIDLLHKYR